MRDYGKFDSYLNLLSADIYTQPPDKGHTAWAIEAINTLCTIPQNISSVLDVGCGQGFLADAFRDIELSWTGVTLGEDYFIAKKKKLRVQNSDMTFLPFKDNTFDMVFARHTLEHSPFPIITLMEWKRVCKGWLTLIAPAPDYWGWKGKNHYSVMALPQLEWLLARSGWNPIHTITFTNRDPTFIQHWKVYQDANFAGDSEKIAEVFEQNPEVDVEYRILCEMAEPALE
jgi:SAM-dependent methyltransferase